MDQYSHEEDSELHESHADAERPSGEVLAAEQGAVERIVIPFPEIVAAGHPYVRLLIRTHVIQEGDDPVAVAARYAAPITAQGDILFFGEKAVAIAQGRAIPLDSIKPRLLARLLSKTIRKSPHGYGLRRPQTMEIAMREVGAPRILLASIAGLVDRLTGRSGDFYRVAGRRVAGIDGPGFNTLPPFDHFVVPLPFEPDRVAQAIADRLGIAAAIVDVNDVGSEVIGSSRGVDTALVAACLRDNPLGQAHQQTPLGLIRAVACGRN